MPKLPNWNASFPPSPDLDLSLNADWPELEDKSSMNDKLVTILVPQTISNSCVPTPLYSQCQNVEQEEKEQKESHGSSKIEKKTKRKEKARSTKMSSESQEKIGTEKQLTRAEKNRRFARESRQRQKAHLERLENEVTI